MFARPLTRLFARASSKVGRFFLRFLLLPLYTLFVLTKIRFERTMVSARGFIFFLFTNRYVFHAALLLVAVATISSQFTTRSVYASNAAEGSLLYALVTQGQEESIDEPLTIATSHTQTRYLGAGTLQALPSIDYDYGLEDDLAADLTIPGTVAVRPQPEPATPNTASDETSPTIGTRTNTETYTVQDGDTVATIARNFNVTVGTVIWANNLSQSAMIKPGNTLRIPPVSGIFHVVKRGETLAQIAQKYEVSADVIAQSNSDISTLAIGKEILIPGGTPIIVPPTRTAAAPTKPTIRAGVPLATIAGKAVDVYQELVSSRTDSRVKPESQKETATKSTTKLLWPTDLRVINQYWNWNHTGLDIDGDYSNALYASEDGIVAEAGWNNGGYGLQVVINHDNGFKTRYGHASKLFVKAGDTVKRGDVIAMMGTTGRSTGTHLHYEVYVKGVRVNPLTYIR